MKAAGTGVSISPTSVDTRHTASSACTVVLADSLIVDGPLSIWGHHTRMREGYASVRTAGKATTETNLDTLFATITPLPPRRLLYALE